VLFKDKTDAKTQTKVRNINQSDWNLGSIRKIAAEALKLKENPFALQVELFDDLVDLEGEEDFQAVDFKSGVTFYLKY